MEPAATPSDLAYRFGLVVLGLCQVVADHVNRDCSNEPFIARIYFSLRRRLKRFEVLFARAQAALVHSGRQDATAPDPQASAASRAPRAADPMVAGPVAAEPGVTPSSSGAAVEALGGAAARIRKPYERLPRKRAWMLDMMPYQASLYWYRLDDLLRDPEMVAFLATSRKARRLLRPLWYGLCLDPLPACLREPPPETILAEAPEFHAAGTVATADAPSPSRASTWREPVHPPGAGGDCADGVRTRTVQATHGRL